MADDIRKSRLARFAQLGVLPTRQEPQASSEANSESPKENEPNKEADSAPIEAASGTSSQQIPSVDPVASSTGTQKLEPKSVRQESQPVEAPPRDPAESVSAKPKITPEQWFHNTVSSVLHVSIVPKQGFVFLPGIAEEKGAGGLITPDDLDGVMWETLSNPDTVSLAGATDIFDYFFSAWERSTQSSRQAQSVPQRRELVAGIQRVLVQFAVICATASSDEDLHGDLGSRLISRVSSGTPWDFIGLILDEAASQELIVDLMAVVFDKLLVVIRKGGISTECINVLAITDNLLANKHAALAITEVPGFDIPQHASPADIASSSWLGSYFAVNPLDNEYPLKLFPGIETMTPLQIQNVVANLRAEALMIMDRLFSITNKIVRSSVDNRLKVLDFFGGVLDRNHKRMAMQVDKATINGDGFMANVAYVVIKFCEPFVDAKGTKLSKIDPFYYRTPGAYDIDEETKLVANIADSKEWLHTDRITERPNFITEIFFLAVGYLQYGVSSLFQSQDRLKRMVDGVQANYDSILPMLQGSRGTPNAARVEFLAKRLSDQLALVKSEAAALSIVLRHEEIMTKFHEFANFAFLYSVNQGDPNHTYPATPLDITGSVDSVPSMVYQTYPEYLIESPIQTLLYVGRWLPQIPRLNLHPEIVEGIIFFLRAPQYIYNPYLKSKMVEVLFFGGMEQPLTNGGTIPGYYAEIFNTNKLALDHLFHALMKLYIDMEQTGRSSQFYDKFNTRELIALIMKNIWHNPIYRENLEKESKTDHDFFVRFVALLLNDSTYLLDEALSKLQLIHRLQTEPQDTPTPDANTTENEDDEANQSPQQRLASAEREAKLYLQLSSSTVELLGTFTSTTPKPFVTPEIVDRLASMLNYNLVALVGPKCRELKVNNPEKYGFNPRMLLTKITSVYLNLASYDEFVRALARDGRSYSVFNFERAEIILCKHGLMSNETRDAWRRLKERAEEFKQSDEMEDEEMADVPEEFLDPLMYTVMENPVILPSSKVTIDFNTIKAHLLSDPIDPFNRQPLRIEDVVPNDELKSQIDEYKRAKRAAREAGKV